MRRLLASLPSRQPPWILILGPAGLILGVAAERALYDWDDPHHWIPDLVVGLTFIVSGSFATKRERGTGVLLVATGFAWFLGNFDASLWYLYRGPLVHLVVTYRGWRPRTRLEFGTVAAGYAAALATPLWRGESTAIVLAVALIVVVGRGVMVAPDRERRDRLLAFRMAAALGFTVAGGAVVRLALPSGDEIDPILLVFQAVLCGVAMMLAAGVRAPTAATVTDLVVELGDTPSNTLRDSLARTLGDPTLEIGYWSPTGVFVDVAGRSVPIPTPADARSATFVERESHPFAVIVHDASVLGEPALLEAVASATRLSAANAGLQAEVRAQVFELKASRRRLLTAADEERHRLEIRLRDGTERRLRVLGDNLHLLSESDSGTTGQHIELAERHLTHALDDLHELARGLHPRELSEGLGPALAALAGRSTVPVELIVTSERFDTGVEVTAYFVCAEALANVAKHAACSRAIVDVSPRLDRLVIVIADDGKGGADQSKGTGLRGLVDRVDTLGGTPHVESPSGSGTRLTAELPLGRPPV